MITVSSKRNPHPTALNVYVGRPSPLSNPFPLHNESQRNEVCDLYEKYFTNAVAKDTEVRKAVIALWHLAKGGDDINLVCHCAPKRCHAGTIKKFLDHYVALHQQ